MNDSEKIRQLARLVQEIVAGLPHQLGGVHQSYLIGELNRIAQPNETIQKTQKS